MALQITKSFTSGGQPFTNAYGRMEAKITLPWTKVEVEVRYYLSKAKFVENETNQFSVDGLINHGTFDYNSLTDTHDILLFAHNKFKDLLAAQVNTPWGENRPNPFYQELLATDIAIVDLD